MKFLEIYRFELWYQLRRPTTWIYFVAVTGLVFLVLDEIVEYARNVDTVLLYAPITVAELSGYAIKFGLLLIAALVGDGAMRDIQARMDPLLYTSSMTRKSYLAARFLGTLTVAGVLMLLVVPVGLVIARYAMNIENSLFGPFRPVAYFHAGLFLTLPAVLFATTLMWVMVLSLKQSMAAYAGALLFFVMSTFNLDFLAHDWELAKLVDPSGITVVEEYRRSISPLLANTALIPLKGSLLANRLLWLVFSVIIGAAAYRNFQFLYRAQGASWKWPAFRKKKSAAKTLVVPHVKITAQTGLFNTRTRIFQTFAMGLDYYMEMIMSRIGLAIPALAIYAFILIPNLSLGPVEVPLLLTTERVLLFMNSPALQILILLLISLLAGQLLWRERDNRLSEISDAAPVPDSVLLLSKYAGLVLVLLSLQLSLVLAGLGIQINAAYPTPDLGLYLQELFGFQLVDLLLLAAIAMVIHVLVNQKYVAHLLVMLFFFYTIKPSLFGLEHKLLQFGSDSGLSTSVFWSQRIFLGPWLLYKAYWLGWTLLLLLVANNMWVRGRETRFKERLLQACKGLKRAPLLIVSSCVLVASAGSLIFYSTNIMHAYTTSAEGIARQVAYEKTYGRYKGVPQPYLTGTELTIELYPEERSALVAGVYQLKNGSSIRIDTLHLSPAASVLTEGIQFNREARLVNSNNHLRHLMYKLEQPLLPGDSVQMHFIVKYSAQGFTNRGIKTAVLENGSYFSSWEWLPQIGYQPGRELVNHNERFKHGLPKQPDLRSLQDSSALMDRTGSENIHFKALIGTSAGQTAVAPGTLQKSWQEAGRQYFYYVADKPVRNRYQIYSACYEVRESYWNDVHLQIYHHPRSLLNLENFEKSMKASLDYYSTHFSPYQYHQLKFVEYPDSGTGAIALPGTVGYSTSFSMLNPAQDHRGFDLPFAVVAHEVAHQWWGHQLSPANAEGAQFLTESLAWYSALGVVAQTHGNEHLQKLLEAMRREYLNPRARAALPLLQAADGYQAYRKGPLAMYALQEYIGEAAVNQALRQLLEKYSSGEPPYATSLNFYHEITKVTPDTLHYLLQDLFATNTFWELETTAATMKPAKDDGWLVTLQINAQKVRVDKEGLEIIVPMDEYIEVGLFGKEVEGLPISLYSKKHRIRSGTNEIDIRVSEKVETAGIDPRHLLIDTEMSDNVKLVKAVN